MKNINFNDIGFTASKKGEDDFFQFNPSITEGEESGIYYCDFDLSGGYDRIIFIVPLIEVHGVWAPHLRYNRGLGFDSDTLGSVITDITSWAPVTTLYSYDGNNSFTAALSDSLNRIFMTGGVNEESAGYKFEYSFLSKNIKNIRIRFDLRKINFSKTLSDVSKWWENFSGYKPADVPVTANNPFYSTWYSYHQYLDEETILSECRKASEYGMEGVFIDDGWQTDDIGRGYAYCGDWKTVSGKIKDLGKLVNKIHNEGLKVILWYAVPYVGVYTDAYGKFKDKFLVISPSYDKWFVLDPRYKDVREFIVSHYINAVKKWDVDGIKLDFLSRFSRQLESENPFKDGMDFEYVADAEYVLFKEIRKKLSSLKSDILLECRQEYIGPVVSGMGNMLRAEDCPACSLTNRVSIIDIKLIAGNTSVHADPIMWNTDDSVESASMQMANAFFGVPQVSMKLSKLSESHAEMLSFYLSTWKEWADVITEGAFSVLSPASNYESAFAHKEGRELCVNYSSSVINIRKKVEKTLVVNSSYNKSLIFRFTEQVEAVINVYNCMGIKTSSVNISFSERLVELDVEIGGMIFVEKI